MPWTKHRDDSAGDGPIPIGDVQVQAHIGSGDFSRKKRRIKSRMIDHTYRDFGQRSVEEVTKVLEYDRLLQQEDEESEGALYPLGRKKAHSFPRKLYDIITNPIYQHIICFMPHGRSWLVLDKALLVSEVLPAHFNHSKFESFNRQVNGWGFKRLHGHGPDRKSYYHECFLRGRTELTSLMRRLIKPGKRIPDREHEPDFYAISKVSPLPGAVIKSPDVSKDSSQEEINSDEGKGEVSPRASKLHGGDGRLSQFAAASPVKSNTYSLERASYGSTTMMLPAQTEPAAALSTQMNFWAPAKPALPAVDQLGRIARPSNRMNETAPLVHQHSDQASTTVSTSATLTSLRPQPRIEPTCMLSHESWCKEGCPPENTEYERSEKSLFTQENMDLCGLRTQYGIDPDPLREDFPTADSSVSLSNIQSNDPILQTFAEIYFSSNPQDTSM